MLIGIITDEKTLFCKKKMDSLESKGHRLRVISLKDPYGEKNLLRERYDLILGASRSVKRIAYWSRRLEAERCREVYWMLNKNQVFLALYLRLKKKQNAIVCLGSVYKNMAAFCSLLLEHTTIDVSEENVRYLFRNSIIVCSTYLEKRNVGSMISSIQKLNYHKRGGRKNTIVNLKGDFSLGEVSEICERIPSNYDIMLGVEYQKKAAVTAYLLIAD